VKSVIRWLLITAGLGSIFVVTRVIAVYFLGVIAFFVAAYQATIVEMTRRVTRQQEQTAAPARKVSTDLPPRLARARSNQTSTIIDLREEVGAVTPRT
jgi:hypothetical protein